MSTLENIRNRLIDRILATKNERFLEAIENIFISTQSDEIVNFTSEQIEILRMSEQDIEERNFISEADLDKSDKKWLQ